MKRRVFCLFLVLLLCAATVLPTAADAYIPPERQSGFDMNYAYTENGTCKALNTFLSNFAEVGLREFSENTSNEDLIAAVLKHLELNAGYYPLYVTAITGPDNAPYMRITGSYFENRMKYLFNKDIAAADCAGYKDGYIEVTADHFGGPIQVFASVYDCHLMDGDVYEVYFDVLQVDTDFSGWYTTAYSNLPWNNLSTLGTGTALIRYAGGKTNDTISTTDFSLVALDMDVVNVPCAGPNLAFQQTIETTPPTQPAPPPETEIPTEAQTEETTAPTEKKEVRPTRSNTEKEDLEDAADDAESSSTSESEISLTLVLVIILVAAVVLLALLLIVIFIIKKRQS